MSQRSKHTASGHSLFMHCSFDDTKKTIMIIIEVKIVLKIFMKI